MKYLIFIFSLFFPLVLSSAPKLVWQWTATAEDASCSYNLVRTEAPLGIESPDYSILVVYSWELKSPCVEQSRTDERVQIEEWASKLNTALADSRVGFSVATIVEPDRIREYYYVSELNAFRSLSLMAGEVLVDAEVNYAFSRDLNWDTWKEIRAEQSEQIHFVLSERN